MRLDAVSVLLDHQDGVVSRAQLRAAPLTPAQVETLLRRRDLVAVTRLFTTRNVLAVHPSVPARTLAEFIALAKAQPGTLSYGHSGVGFSTHLTMELLKQAAGIEVTGVPYAAEGQMFTDLAAGRVPVAVGLK